MLWRETERRSLVITKHLEYRIAKLHSLPYTTTRIHLCPPRHCPSAFHPRIRQSSSIPSSPCETKKQQHVLLKPNPSSSHVSTRASTAQNALVSQILTQALTQTNLQIALRPAVGERQGNRPGSHSSSQCQRCQSEPRGIRATMAPPDCRKHPSTFRAIRTADKDRWRQFESSLQIIECSA